MIFSIRYKFILALILVSATCLFSYTFLVRRIFEKDKKAAIFESTSQANKMAAESLKLQIEEILKLSQNLIYTIENGQFNVVGKKIIAERPELLFIALSDANSFKAMQINNKNYSELYIKQLLASNYPLYTELNSQGHSLLTVQVESAIDPSKKINLFVGYDFKKHFESFRFSTESGGTILVAGQSPIGFFDEATKTRLISMIEKTDFDEKKIEFSFMQNILGKEYLSSYRWIGFPDLYIFTSFPKDLAYAGLYKIYESSIKFFLIVIFLVLGIAILMSSSLLRHLSQLTAASNEMASGNFDLKIHIKSSDEVGVLSNSFLRMSHEIKRLLLESHEKARMESELKTAQAVQNTLFPKRYFINKHIEIDGLYRSASECAGDWWYYFSHPTGTYGIVADATGHGAPAALITAAAKSAVNLVQRDQNLNLEKLVDSLNYSLYETAKGEIMMTAFLFHINQEYEVKVVNASHEAPIIITPAGVDFLIVETSPRLGQSKTSSFIISTTEFAKDSTLFIYTDGITSQVNERQKEFGEKKLAKFYQNFKFHQKTHLQKVNFALFNEVDLYKGNIPQHDDLTVVAVRLVTDD